MLSHRKPFLPSWYFSPSSQSNFSHSPCERLLFSPSCLCCFAFRCKNSTAVFYSKALALLFLLFFFLLLMSIDIYSLFSEPFVVFSRSFLKPQQTTRIIFFCHIYEHVVVFTKLLSFCPFFSLSPVLFAQCFLFSEASLTQKQEGEHSQKGEGC